MKIIGLTGGSGTGKGTVAARMRSLGAGWVDADAVYRGLCAENREMLDALDAAFGGVTFPVEVQNQGGDYSYFLKNVQKYSKISENVLENS